MTNSYIRAKYWIETPLDLADAAAVLAGEQSSGTFVSLPEETRELLALHGARVDAIDELEPASDPSLRGYEPPSGLKPPHLYRRAEIQVSFPHRNVGNSVPNLLTAVAGNLFDLQQFSGLRLIDIDVPTAFAGAHAGPAFGVDGTKALLDVGDRPVIGTIMKPSVGLSPDRTASLVAEMLDAGVDFIKDDELIADVPYSPLATRVDAVMRTIKAHETRTGHRAMYAFNITGTTAEMRRNHDVVVAAGGTCVMVSLNSVGLAAVSDLRSYAQVPIHGHRNGWAMIGRDPEFGMSFKVYQKLWRFAGIDHLHVNGLRNKFWESDESVIASAKACLEPIFGRFVVMPVFSSGQWAGQAADTYHALGTTDLMYLAGGGIMGHPSGPSGGVASIRQAWDAALEGIPITEAARTNPMLAQALDKFGSL